MGKYKKSNNEAIHSWPVIGLILILLVFFGYKLILISKKSIEAKQNKNAVLAQIEMLKEQEDRLREDIQKLDTEEGVEEKIREKFRVAKDGEKVIFIFDEKGSGEDKKKGFFGRIGKFFGLGAKD